MKISLDFFFIIVSTAVFFLISCSGSFKNALEVSQQEDFSSSSLSEKISEDKDPEENILIIIGEGGPSGGLFIKAAKTYQKKFGGEIYEVKSGDEFVNAMHDFTNKKGKISHLEYFGHGNHIGLFVNQTPNVNGGLYANDPAQNEAYLAASIYELNEDSFKKGGTMQFNGCNIAAGYPTRDSLAQRFANYFNVMVRAPTGPTEFSSKSDSVSPIPGSNFLGANFSGDVFMVPSNAEKGFVEVSPQPFSESRFSDVRKGASYAAAVAELEARGLNLNFQENKFLPYKNITYGQAREFCRIAVSDIEKCVVAGLSPEDTIRNLKALKMLADAFAVKVESTSPWHKGYIWWAQSNGLLTEDFTNKKWYTRGEMAELTWNFMEKLEK